MSINKLLKEADKLEFAALDMAICKVESMARSILKRKPHLKEFVMGMGTYFFTDNKGKIVFTTSERLNSSYNYYSVDATKYFNPLNNFIGEYNSRLKITGYPMRFTANGKKITNW